MAKVGRPQIEIDQKSFENLCNMHCTLNEIAGFFDCSEDTIELYCKRTYGINFTDVYKDKSARGKISLRRLQWKSAEKGNVTMQIWLGKQLLGQRETLDANINNDDSVQLMQDFLENIKKSN